MRVWHEGLGFTGEGQPELKVWRYGNFTSEAVQQIPVFITLPGEPKLKYELSIIQDGPAWSVNGLSVGGVQAIPSIAETLMMK